MTNNPTPPDIIATVTLYEIRDATGAIVNRSSIVYDLPLKATGTAAPNTDLWLRDGAKELVDVTSSSTGRWTKEFTPPLKCCIITVIEKNPPQDYSLSHRFTAATRTPLITTVIGDEGPIVEGDTYYGDSLEFSGNSLPSTKLKVLDDLAEFDQEATVNSCGLYKFTLDALIAKQYKIKFQTPDGTESDVFSFIAAKESPLVIDDVVDEDDNSIGEGVITVKNILTIKGKARAKSKVELRGALPSAVTVDVNENGNWAYTTPALPPAPYSITARADYDSDNPTLPRTFTVALDIPLVINDVVDEDDNSIGEGNTTVKNILTIKGMARAYTKVELLGALPASVKVDVNEDGDWEYKTPALPPALYSVTARADYDSDNPTPPRTFTVALDIPLVIDDVVDEDDNSIGEGNTTVKNILTIKGKARAKSKVELRGALPSLVTVDVNENGNWEHTTPALPAAPYSVTAQADYDSDNPTVPRTFIVRAVIEVTLDSITDTDNNVIIDGGSTSKDTLLVLGKGEPGKRFRIINQADADQEVGGGEVEGTGDYKCEIGPLSSRLYKLVTEGLYTEGGVSGPYTVEVKAIEPPAITGVRGEDNEIIEDNGSTRSTYLVFRGTAVANMQVKLIGFSEPITDTTNGDGLFIIFANAPPPAIYTFHVEGQYDSYPESPTWTIKVLPQ